MLIGINLARVEHYRKFENLGQIEDSPKSEIKAIIDDFGEKFVNSSMQYNFESDFEARAFQEPRIVNILPLSHPQRFRLHVRFYHPVVQ